MSASTSPSTGRRIVQLLNPEGAGGTRANRAQAQMIGVVLMIAVVGLLYGSIQATYIPTQEQRAEFQHSQQVTADLETVQASMLTASASGQFQSNIIRMGTQYNRIPGFLYSPSPSGSLQTSETLRVQVANAQAVEPETQDYIDGSRLSFTTKPLVYSPNYNQYDAPDFVLAHGNLIADYENDREVASRVSPIRGRSIDLSTQTHDMNFGTGSALQLNTYPLSASDTTVPVESSGGHIQIALETKLSIDEWRVTLGNQIDSDTSAGDSSDGDGKYIAEIEMDTSTDPNTLIIHMEGDTTYSMGLSRLGLRTGEEATFGDPLDPDPHYLATRSPTDPVVAEATTTEIVVQVRDRYNNPMSNVPVEINPSVGTVRGDNRVLTDAEGEVTFQYRAPQILSATSDVSFQTADVTVSAPDISGARGEITYEVEVQNIYDRSGGS